MAFVARVPDASAHGLLAGIRVVIDGISPEVPGLVVSGGTTIAEEVRVENSSPIDLLVLDEGGTPFLRIGPAGVHANLSSPMWERSNTILHRPPQAAPHGQPEWVGVSSRPHWSWLDPRLHSSEPAASFLARATDTTLPSWTIPMLYGDERVVIRGHGEYRARSGTLRAVIAERPVGLVVEASQGDIPLLSARLPDPSARAVLLGADGEPFVRLDATGAAVNEASPAAGFLLATLAGSRTLPVDARAEPRWRIVSTVPELTWLDPRVVEPDPDRLARGRSSAAERRAEKQWSVPVLLNGSSTTLRGALVWSAPPEAERSSGRAPVAAVLIACAVMVVALPVLFRRGRRRPSTARRRGRRG